LLIAGYELASGLGKYFEAISNFGKHFEIISNFGKHFEIINYTNKRNRLNKIEDVKYNNKFYQAA
ncbi:hypothetical protein ACT59Q_04090, partial [Campylobacter coli]|uniref:hypothetical protein n=1 Tax=Campylobacter coli TaxID=195 RepID=UPI0040338C21